MTVVLLQVKGVRSLRDKFHAKVEHPSCASRHAAPDDTTKDHWSWARDSRVGKGWPIGLGMGE